MTFDLAALHREVHVWIVELVASRPVIERTYSMLAEPEKQRAERYRFPRLRDSFVLSRGALRRLIAGYADTSPERIEFAYGSHGKPSLAAPESRLSFNLSHSGDLAAYAFTVDGELGIDIEHASRTLDFEGLASRFFGREECQDLVSLPEASRAEAFFRCWVRKESYIKALGGGLSIPLDSFRVTLLPGQPAAIVDSDWALHAFCPAPGYEGALSLRDKTRAIRIHPLTTAGGVLPSTV
jgi:4'-phosphopantetheinyl transferase